MIATKQSPFTENTRLLVRLHELIRQGNDCEQADALRDQMDVFWHELSADEKSLIRGLSADLKTIGVDRPERSGADPDRFHGFDHEDWPGMLAQLREHEHEMPAHEVASCRGACWAYLSQPHVAIVFFLEKERIKPLAADEEVLLLTCMVQDNRLDEAIERAHRIQAIMKPSRCCF